MAADLQGTLMRGQHWSSPSSRGLPTPSTPMAYSLSLSRMSPSSPYSLSLSLSPSACHHAPLTSSHGRTAYPVPPPSRPCVFGWLLHDKISNGGHRRPLSYFIFVIFFCHSICRPEIRKTPPPIHSNPAAHPLHHPSYRCHQLLVDRCVLGPITDTVDANSVFIVLVRNVAILVVLVVVVFVALMLP